MGELYGNDMHIQTQLLISAFAWWLMHSALLPTRRQGCTQALDDFLQCVTAICRDLIVNPSPHILFCCAHMTKHISFVRYPAPSLKHPAHLASGT